MVGRNYFSLDFIGVVGDTYYMGGGVVGIFKVCFIVYSWFLLETVSHFIFVIFFS